MIYQIPTLMPEDHEVIGLIENLRSQLEQDIHTGFLRQNAFTDSAQASDRGDGTQASFDKAVAIVDGEAPETAEGEDQAALLGYSKAMAYILQIRDDPHFELHADHLKSFHYMMLGYDKTKAPGQWRLGESFITLQPSGERIYEGPEGKLVPGLVDELVAQLKEARDVQPFVRGAMAHLNLTMIHPFLDGNGRVARVLQTLIMARDGILSPIFSSIEDWLVRNTPAYYAILAEVGQGKWHPENSALPWVRFCLRAHYQQAATLINRNAEIERIWEEISKIIKKHDLPPRTEIALMDATFGTKVRNSAYQTEQEISADVASGDLQQLCDLGLLMPVEENQDRFYVGTDVLEKLGMLDEEKRNPADPYELVGKGFLSR